MGISGYNKTVNKASVSTPTMDLNGLFKTNYTGSVNESTKYQQKEQTIDINIDEYMDIEIKPEEPKKAWYEQLWDAAGDFFSDVGEVLAATGATIAVGATSILSGVADIGEMLVDGVTWVGAAGADLLGFDDAAKDMREFISRDLVSEANQAFYENTEIGKAINDASVLKYDSEVAQGIREVTTTVTEIAAATALTVVTGGAAAPLVVGTVVGLGKAAESTYQTNGTDTNLLQEGGILLSGGLNGLSWMANGKLGAGAIEIGKDVASLGAKEVLSNMSKEILTTDFLKASLKKGLASKQAIGNYVSATFMTASSAIPYITGREEFDATAALKITGKFTTSLALNVVEDAFRDYVTDYKAGKFKIVDEIEILDESPKIEQLEEPVGGTSEKVKQTTAINHDILNERYHGTRVNLEEFIKKPLEEQLDIVKNNNIYNLRDLLGKEDITPEVMKELTSRFIANQDLVFLKNVKGYDFSDEIKFFVQDEKFLSKLSDENIVKALAAVSRDDDYSKLLSEVAKRVDDGHILFNLPDIEKSMMGLKISTIDSAYSRVYNKDSELADKIMQSIDDYIKEYMPDNIKDLKLGRITTLRLTDAINNGSIDKRGLDYIKQIYNLNPEALNNFDFRVLNSDMIDLFGEDFIKGIGTYSDLSAELLSLKNTNQKLYNIYADIIKETYKDPSLNNIYTISSKTLDFIFENSDHLNNSDDIDPKILTQYILFNSNNFSTGIVNRFNIDLTNNYFEDYYKKCDTEFAEAFKKYTDLQTKTDAFSIDYYSKQYIDSMKDIYIQKYFSLNTTEARALITKYGDHIDEIIDGITDEETLEKVKMIEYLKTILDMDNPSKLADLYNNQNIKIGTEEMLAIDDILRKEYNKTYEKALTATSDLLSSKDYTTVMYNGKEVKIIPTQEFSFLVYSSDTGFTVEKTLLNDSYIDTWNNVNNGKTHGLSTSFITSENIGSCPVERSGVLYGFTDVSKDNIRAMGPYDINSNIANYGFGTNNQQIFIPAESMSRNTTRVYNEFVLDRNAVSPNYIVLYSDASETLRNNAIKAAAEWDIPIVEIDIQKLATSQAQKISDLTDTFQSSKKLSDLQEALEIYEANVSGYKLNVNTDIEMPRGDATATVSHDSIKGIFDSTKLETTILDYIDELKKTNNQTGIKDLQDVLLSIQNKYNITETNGTGIISHTKSGIDVNTLLELLMED